MCARRRSRPPASRAIVSSSAPGARPGVGSDSVTPKLAAAGSDKVMTRPGPPARAIASARKPLPAASNTASTGPSARPGRVDGARGLEAEHGVKGSGMPLG
jgi:hypothetical protein